MPASGVNFSIVPGEKPLDVWIYAISGKTLHETVLAFEAVWALVYNMSPGYIQKQSSWGCFLETYFEARPKLVEASAIALGFFDGVHPGHKIVIETAVREARRLGVKAGVVTFKDHPRALTRGQSPMLLSVIEQRLALFEDLGVEVALVLSFTEELCLKSPRAYVEDVLVGSMGARSISVGHNHHFGKDREGDADLLRSLGKDLGFSVNTAEMVHINGKEVSSSLIRNLVAEGRMQEARELLSHPFAVLGEVSRGDGRGRTIGVPTANLGLYQYQMIPKNGVYAGRARIASEKSSEKSSDKASEKASEIASDNPSDCVINVGTRPTFEDASLGERPTVEAHLLDCDRDLYGKRLEVTFLEFIRDERKFAGAEELTAQIKEDIEKARNFLRRDQKGEKLPA